MRRHDTRWTSLIVGLTFAAIAIAYLSASIDGRTLQVRWVTPILLIGLGISGVVATLLRLRTPEPTARPDDESPSTVD
jgi:hypothetical protein